MVKPLQAENLKTLYGMKHGFFTRKGGVSQGTYAGLNCGLSSEDDPNDVEENRRLVSLYFDIPPKQLVSCKQVHSPNVVKVIEPWFNNERPEADSMVTRMRGLALGILTADCVPLLFADPMGGVIGAAHAGWRGALSGIIENTIRTMEDNGGNRSTMQVAIGPCIWQNSYEVGPEFPAPFLAEKPDNQKFFRPAFKSGHYMFDLPGYVEAKLKAFGVHAIEKSPADTASDEDRFFSYRRNTLKGIKGVGSLLSAIMLIQPTDDEEDSDTWDREYRDGIRGSLARDEY